MKAYSHIEQKLAFFYKKYYTNELIKGAILFCFLGALFFFIIVYLEFFLWLTPFFRSILLVFFIFIEGYLFFKFILKPILYLIKLKNGIKELESSKIIGDHFSEVQDKLLNILQLKEFPNQSELLLASIEQKSKELSLIQFSKAVNFKKNIVFVKYLLLPFFIWLLSFLTGTNNEFSNSLTRIVNSQTVFFPPAPFTFHLITNDLDIIEGSSHTILLTTTGDISPDDVEILYGGQTYFLQKKSSGVFYFTFSNVLKSFDFSFKSDGVISNIYTINVIKTPIIQNMTIALSYPKYTNKNNQLLVDTGNLFIPEGTKIIWQVTAYQTDTVSFLSEKQRNYFTKTNQNRFIYNKIAHTNISYSITSSNSLLKDFEALSYNLRVIKDMPPTILVNSNIDSLQREVVQFGGQISDDYGFSNLTFFYYNKELPLQKKSFSINLTNTTFQTFFLEFPNKIKLDPEIDYEMYFQVTDNDAINGNKIAVSKKFTYNQKTREEVIQEQLKNQKETIKNLEKSIQSQQQQKINFTNIQNEIQNKKSINWSDKKKVQEFLSRQKKYEQMMDRQTENLQDFLDQKTEENQPLQDKKEQLQKRIDELLKLNKQKKLLDELQKIAEKLDKDELIKKAKQLAQQNKQQERSLERILELTKRFYVEEKALQIANKLQKLAKKQDTLKNTNKKALSEQQDISNEFDKISKELDELSKDNQKLKEPLEIPQQDEEILETKQSLSKSEDELSNQKDKEARKSQKKSSKQMQQMSQKMQQAISDMQANSINENIDDLRKILENLIVFSFKQEKLLLKFQDISVSHPDFGTELKNQNELKTYFEHIDDSLFVLSMRLPKLSTKIQTELSDTHYNLDLSLDNFSENRFQSAASNQQYVMTSVNNLAHFLSDLLNNLQNKMGSPGQGDGQGNPFSLPTLIEEQKGISDKMKKGLQQQQGKKGEQKNLPNGDKDGNSGKNKNSSAADEQSNGELYKLYQQQNILRNQLKEALIKSGKSTESINRVLKTMEQLEKDILDNGFNQTTLNRMEKLDFELLKLDNAFLMQGNDTKRESNTNSYYFQKKRLKDLLFKKEFYNQIEILNRQSLPLQQNFKNKVKTYFDKNNKF